MRPKPLIPTRTFTCRPPHYCWRCTATKQAGTGPLVYIETIVHNEVSKFPLAHLPSRAMIIVCQKAKLQRELIFSGKRTVAEKEPEGSVDHNQGTYPGGNLMQQEVDT